MQPYSSDLKIYTTTGLGRRKKKRMAGVDHFLVYMQTAVKYNYFYIHHPGGVQLITGHFSNNLRGGTGAMRTII